MKFFASELAYFLRGRARQNLKVLLGYITFLTTLIVAYSYFFTVLMWRMEGRDYSFIAGLYWVITAMTTLGYGDITFNSDPGFLFSVLVTLSGVVLLLIVLPFGIISLFLGPWLETRLRYRPTQKVPETTVGHILICGMDPVTRTFIVKLQQRGIPFFVVTPNYDEALRLEEDEGFKVILGDPSDSKVLRSLRVESARYVVANLGDTDNTNLALTVRSLCATPVAVFVDEPEHAEFLRLAGASQVIPLKKILGRYLATRATTQGALAHVLDAFGKMLVAELPVHGTSFSGKKLGEARIREQTGLAVVGIWERGNLTVPTRDTLLSDLAVMVVVGTRENLETLERITGEKAEEDLVLIIGHGRIGCAAAEFLERKPVPFILMDRQVNDSCEDHIAVLGDATRRHTLTSAGIDQAKGLIVTTNDDGANIFLTLVARHLNPHIRIVARANREEDIDELYAAGADFVVSNASVGAAILMNILENKESIFLSEGMHVFRYPLPRSLEGKTIESSRLRPTTGCTIIALERPGEDELIIVPPPETTLIKGMNLILIGAPEQERRCRAILK